MNVEPSTALNFKTIKESTVREVMTLCAEYVKIFLSNEAAKSFLGACKAGNDKEVKRILINTLNRAKANLYPRDIESILGDTSQYDTNGNVKNLLGDACQKSKNNAILRSISGEKERRESATMAINTVIVIVAILLVIAAIGAVVYLKNKDNKKVDDILSHAARGEKKMIYTEKDRDMVMLIRDLAEVYENTEKYLKS